MYYTAPMGNLGRSDYLSSILQILFRYRPFTDTIKRCYTKSANPKSIIGALYNLINLHNITGASVDSREILDFLNLNINEQEDACSILTKLFSSILDAVQIFGDEMDTIKRVFFSDFVNSFQIFPYLYYYLVYTDQQGCPIRDIFYHTLNIKSESIYRPGNMLTLRVERVSNGRKGSFPLFIDMELNIQQGRTYYLYACIVYPGVNDRGRCVAYIKDKYGWLKCSDDSVQNVDDSVAMNDIIYNSQLLMYVDDLNHISDVGSTIRESYPSYDDPPYNEIIEDRSLEIVTLSHEIMDFEDKQELCFNTNEEVINNINKLLQSKRVTWLDEGVIKPIKKLMSTFDSHQNFSICLQPLSSKPFYFDTGFRYVVVFSLIDKPNTTVPLVFHAGQSAVDLYDYAKLILPKYISGLNPNEDFYLCVKNDSDYLRINPEDSLQIYLMLNLNKFSASGEKEFNVYVSPKSKPKPFSSIPFKCYDGPSVAPLFVNEVDNMLEFDYDTLFRYATEKYSNPESHNLYIIDYSNDINYSLISDDYFDYSHLFGIDLQNNELRVEKSFTHATGLFVEGTSLKQNGRPEFAFFLNVSNDLTQMLTNVKNAVKFDCNVVYRFEKKEYPIQNPLDELQNKPGGYFVIYSR